MARAGGRQLLHSLRLGGVWHKTQTLLAITSNQQIRIKNQLQHDTYVMNMFTTQSQAKEVVAPNDNEDDDIGVLIYREFQLRKAEAAAAAERKTKSTASTRRTSSRKRLPINYDESEKSIIPSPQRNIVTKARSKRKSSLDEDGARKNMAKKKRTCSAADGCTNNVVRGGVCVRHGAKIPRCSSAGCPNQVIQGGVCTRHGAKVKRCSSKRCTNKAVKGGVCVKHGAKVKRCNKEGCTNQAIQGGVCVRHGAKVKR